MSNNNNDDVFKKEGPKTRRVEAPARTATTPLPAPTMTVELLSGVQRHASEPTTRRLATEQSIPAKLFEQPPDLDCKNRYEEKDIPDTQETKKPRTTPDIPAFGWNLEKLIFRRADKDISKDPMKTKLQANSGNIGESLERLADCFQKLSIQVEFINNPARAKLRTVENVDLVLSFFEELSGTVYVEIQRCQGDFSDAGRYTREILKVVRGDTIENPVAEPLVASQSRGALEDFLARIAATAKTATQDDAKWAKPPTQDESMKVSITSIHTSLTSSRIDQRKSGLDNLTILTDMEKTLSQSVVASSLIVIEGMPPTDEYEQQCVDIQRVLLSIIVKQQFEVDDTNMYASMDADMVGFLSGDSSKEEGRSRYYDNYMTGMIHSALTILSNSLEALETLKEDDRHNFDMRAAIFALNSACLSSFATGIVEALMKIVGQAQRKLPDAYLACKALRLLLGANPDLCLDFRSNPKHKETVGTAIAVGAHHVLLQSEAKQLQTCF